MRSVSLARVGPINTRYLAVPAPAADSTATKSLTRWNNSGTTVVDEVSGNSWSLFGNATQDGSTAMVAGNSLSIPATGGYARSLSNMSKYLFGTGDFRITFTVLWDRANGGVYPCILDYRDSGGTVGKGWCVYGTLSTGAINFYCDNGGGSTLDFQIGTIPNDGSKSEVEINRKSGVMKCYVRGTKTYDAAFTWNFTYQATQLVYGLRYYDAINQFVGRLDEVLIEAGATSGGHTTTSYAISTLPFTYTPPPAGIVYGTAVGPSGNDGKPGTLVIPAGALAIYCLGEFVQNVGSVTGSSGGSYTRAVIRGLSDNNTSEIWYLANHPGGSETYTIGGDAGGYATGIAFYVTGAATSSVVDRTAQGGYVDGNTATLSTGAANTTANSLEVVVGTAYQSVNPITSTLTAGWTKVAERTDSANYTGMVVGYRIVTATETASCTITSNGAAMSMAIATFKGLS